MQRISPEQAHNLIAQQRYVYVDVRSVAEFEGGHPEGAYNIPLSHLSADGMVDNPDFLSDVGACFERGQGLIVGCKSGVRSLSAARLLVEAGFSDVLEQRAGFDGVTDPFGRVVQPGWRALGLPVSFDAWPGRSYAALRGRQPRSGEP